MSGYLSYTMIAAAHDESNPVEVKCYSNGFYWIVPDPTDLKRAEYYEEGLKKGLFIKCISYMVPPSLLTEAISWPTN